MITPNVKYLINIDVLNPGDVILTSSSTGISKSIRLATNSEFSHVMLHVDNGMCMHADSDGVHSFNLQRLLLDSNNSAIVLRLKESEKFKEAITYACNIIQGETGKSYSKREAILSKVFKESNERKRENRQFCSRLIAQAYDASNVQIVANPDYCYPSDFLNSSLLEPVNDCIEIASDDDIEFANSDSPLDLQKRITNEIMSSARKLLGVDVQSFDEIENALNEKDKAKFEGKVADIVKASGYLEFGEIDVKKNAWRYNGTILMAAANIDDLEKLNTAKRELILAEKDIKKFSNLFDKYSNRYITHGFIYDKQLTELWHKMTTIHLARKKAAEYVIEKMIKNNKFY